MLGILISILFLFYLIYNAICNQLEDYHGRQHYRNDRLNTYRDHNNVLRDLDTNKYRSVERRLDGDVYLYGEDIGYVNISQKEREKKLLAYKAKVQRGDDIGRTTIYWGPGPKYDRSKEINILGKRYKDIVTDEILIVREHNYKFFYVRVESFKVMRYTDFQVYTMKEKNWYSKEVEEKDVEDFQNHINNQIDNSNYTGDPTKGANCLMSVSRLRDYWKGERDDWYL